MAHQSTFLDLKKIVAERTSPILFWIGAGVSVPAGMPTWSRLRNELLAALKERVRQIGDGKEKIQGKLKAAEALQSEPWRCFQLLKEGLGPLEYEANIRRLISPETVSKLPRSYEIIAKINPRAVLNLNIDRLATRAINPSLEFSGKEVANYFQVFRDPRNFVVNLHGDIDNVSSWVFTENELAPLLDREEYKQFIGSCLSQFCCVFVGISPFDVAVGGHLERFARAAPSSGPHFWLTDINTYDLDQWAQKARLHTVRYKSSGDNHDELYELLEELANYKSVDLVEDPVLPSVKILDDGSTSVPSPDDLATLPAEEIRFALNRAVKRLLAPANPDAYEAYAKFCEEYEVPVYRAWHITDKPPSNVLLGYSLEKKVGGGAFGSVFKAVSKDGTTVAIKVLHQAARTEAQMVQSFRRGVRAMSITTSSKLPGVSVFRAASEVPALVVMDWISGPTLKEALFAKQLNSVFERLDIVTQLTSIIRDAHALPARVLHRDIRPNNVMLRDFWETGKIDVVVLDFDLSWHKDATELSIIHGASTSGYLSPEQLDVNTKFSTRSALVDSFGLGMTIFFIFSGRDPVPGESDQREWQEVLKRLAKEWSMADWRSFGSRLARLIGVTTHHDQSRRWDADQIVRELKRLGRALKGEIVGLGADVLSEELFARSFGDQYEAVDGGQSFSRNSIAGTLVNVVPTRDGQDVDLRVSWTDSGQHDYKRVRKWITPALDSACQILSSTGWSINNRRSDPQELEISARISVEDLTAKLDALSKGLQKVADEVAFS